MGTMSPLRRRMIEDMRIRNLSPARRQSYIHAVAKFSDILAGRPIGLDWKTCAPIRSIWL